jgi:hypothetical protein
MAVCGTMWACVSLRTGTYVDDCRRCVSGVHSEGGWLSKIRRVSLAYSYLVCGLLVMS